MIAGRPGTGKTTLAMQFLIEGVKHEDRCLYVTLSETRAEIEKVARSHGWDLSQISIIELVPSERNLSTEAQLTVFNPSELELGETTQAMIAAVDTHRPTRLVLDSLSEIRLIAQNGLRYRRQVLALKHFFSGRQCLVELHGGTIAARSAGKGHGSTFTLSLPLMATFGDFRDFATNHHPSEAAFADPLPEPPRASLRGLKVLVVDDEPDARALIRTLLEERDACVVTAASAEEALELLASEHPDLLISDVGMPIEDGYHLIRSVRALRDDRGATPAIALTAYARVEDRMKAIEAGYQMHLAKPVEPAELITMVSSWKRGTAPASA